jgi:hypothetical protein
MTRKSEGMFSQRLWDCDNLWTLKKYSFWDPGMLLNLQGDLGRITKTNKQTVSWFSSYLNWNLKMFSRTFITTTLKGHSRENVCEIFASLDQN